jgi:hypothetical protein
MPRTPDRHPGESDDEGIVLENMSPGQDPTTAGGIRYVNGSFKLKDSTGVFNPRTTPAPGGTDTQVQFNDGGSTFGGDAGLTYNKTTDALTITGDLAINGGNLTSTSATFNLVNTGVTTLSVGSGATTINIGNSGGTNIISGTTKFPNGLSGSLTQSGATAGSVFFAGTGGVLSQNNSNFFWDNTNARLGVGTSSPAVQLDISGSGDSQIRLKAGGVDLRVNATGASGGIIGTYSAHDLIFFTNATNQEKMRITAAGLVGVGTATLDNRFSVYTTNANGTDGLRVFGGATLSNVRIRPAMSAGANNNIVAAGDSGIIFDAGSVDTGAFVIAPWATGTSGLRIASTGNISIGTSTSLPRLFVFGSSTASTPTMIVKEGVVSPTAGVGVFDVQNSAGTSILFVSGSSRVGILNTSPLAKLHIGAGSSGPSITGSDVFISNAGTTNLAIRDSTNNVELMNYAYSGGGLIGTATAHSLGLRVGNATKLTLDTSGNATLENGNLIIGTSGKGVDFSTTADAAGKTSELFDDYEKGTWTPAFVATSNSWTYLSQTGNYTKIGNIVHATFVIWTNVRTGSVNNALSLSGFPYSFNDVDISSLIYATGNLGGSAFLNPGASASGTSQIYVVSTGAAAAAGANIASSGTIYYGSITYRT